MSVISRVSGSVDTGYGSSVTTHTITPGVTPTPGNLGVVVIRVGSSTGHTLPAGWSTAKLQANCYILYKILGTDDSGNPNWEFLTSTSEDSAWVYAEYASTSGWPANPVDTSGGASGGSSITELAASTDAAPSTADNLVISGVGSRTNTSDMAWTNGLALVGNVGYNAGGGYIEADMAEEFEASTAGVFSSTASWTYSTTYTKHALAVFKPNNTSWTSEVSEIAVSGDDGHIDGNSFYNTEVLMYWGQWETDAVQHLFMRFDPVAVPQGATIQAAYLHLYFVERLSGSDTLPATIKAEDADDPNALTSKTDWDNRTPTTAEVTWTFDAGGAWSDNTWYTSPDIKTVIQEIVDRTGWATGQAMMLYAEDEGPTPVGNEVDFRTEDAYKHAWIEILYTTGNDYDETGRSVAITATVAATDVHGVFYDETGRTVSVIATVAATDTHYINYDETGRLVAVTATVAATDQQDGVEDVAVAVTATVDATDTLTDNDSMLVSESVLYFVEEPTGTNYDETGRVVNVAATVTATDTWATTDDVAVAITATVAATDARTLTDEAVTVAIAATVTGTDQWDATDDVTVAITSTVTATDDRTLTDEDRLVAIVSTVTATDAWATADNVQVDVTSSVTATDDRTIPDENVSVAITSSVAATDDHNVVYTEAVTVNITATVTATDDRTLTDENVAVAVTSTVTGTDTAEFTDAVTVAILGNAYGTDSYQQPGAFEENVVCHIVSSTAITDQADFTDDQAVSVTATVTGTDAWATSEAVTVAITSSVAGTDLAGRVEDVAVAVVGAVFAADDLSSVEALTVSVTATVTPTDVYTPAEQFVEDVSVAITSSVTASDATSFVDDVSVSITGTVTATDQPHWATLEEDVTVAITSTVAATDRVDWALDPVTVTIIATVVATDVFGNSETGVVAITATVVGTDDWTQNEAGLVAITATVSSTDEFSFGEAVTIEILSAIVATDRGDFIDATVVPVQATVGSWDDWYMLLAGATAGVGTVTEEQHPSYIGSDGDVGRSQVGQEPGVARQ